MIKDLCEMKKKVEINIISFSKFFSFSNVVNKDNKFFKDF